MSNKHSIYVHVPFCSSKCKYCDFVSYAGKQEYQEAYFSALGKEIAYASSLYAKNIDTIYIGGGTPSLVDPKYIAGLLDQIDTHFTINRNCEISMEANPGTLDDKRCHAYASSGINRISLGMQAAQPHLLHLLGRTHDLQDVTNAVSMLRNAGIQDINLDLIFAIPTQTKLEWMETLRSAITLSPTHISAYGLIIEQGTPFEHTYRNGTGVSDDLDREMYHVALDMLKQQGFDRYEISNFAREGYECRHNLYCWQMEEYLGLGVNAHSYLDCSRTYNETTLESYLARMTKDGLATASKHQLQISEQIGDFIILALRTTKGVCKQRFYEKFRLDIHDMFHDEIERLKEECLLVETKTHLRLSKRGFDLANTVMSFFL